jgi:hypothetical protein
MGDEDMVMSPVPQSVKKGFLEIFSGKFQVL